VKSSNFKRYIHRDKPKQQIVESLVQSFFRENPQVEKAVISLKEERMNRTQRQNALYWIWVKELSEQTGYTKDAMHDILRDKFLGYREVKAKDKIIRALRSTTDLNVDQFKEYLQEIDFFSADFGIQLPHPEDLYYESMGYKRNE